MSNNKSSKGYWSKKDSNTSKKNNYKRSVIKDSKLKFIIGDQQAEKFDKIVKHLTAEAQREYGYSITCVIEYRKEFDFDDPVRKISTNTEKALKEAEQQGYDMVFGQELKVLTQKKDEYSRNKEKMCGTILKKVSAGLEETMKKEVEYPKKKGTDPIWLLEKIEYYCKTYRGNKYLPAVYMNAVKDVAEITQGNSESVTSFADRLKSRMQLMWESMASGGDVNYPSLTKEMRKTDSKLSPEEARKQAREQVLAHQLINRANPKRFGELKQEIQKLESREVEKYPMTLAKAMEQLQDHEQQKRREFKPKQNNQNNQSQKGNEKNDQKKVEGSYAQNQKTGNNWICQKCGSSSCDSTKEKCSHYSKPVKEQAWFVALTKTQSSNIQTEDTKSVVLDVSSVTQDTTTSNSGKKKESSCLHYLVFQTQNFTTAADMRNGLIFDTGTTISVVGNTNLIKDRHTQRHDEVTIATNGGDFQVNKKANLTSLAKLAPVWYNPQVGGNVLSFAEIEDHPTYELDYIKEHKCFRVTDKQSGQTYDFERKSGGRLYIHMPRKHTTQVQTIKEMKKQFSTRKNRNADRAKDLMAMLNYSSVADFKAIVRTNALLNNPVRVEDIDIMEKIYGKDLATLKGKTTRSNHTKELARIVPIPDMLLEANKNVLLYVDIMYVNGLTFLTTISEKIRYRTAHHLPDRKANTVFESIDHVFRMYSLAGFHISHIRVDPEFYPLLAPLADELDCQIDELPAQAHVPQAKRNNRTLKECIRCIYAAMPFNRLSAELVKHMAFDAASKLNYFPVQGGIAGYSPRSLLGLPQIDYNQHLKTPIGTYCQVHHLPQRTNTNALRTLDCLYLCTKSNQLTLNHEFLHLATNKIITWAHFTPLPMPQTVIDRVHAIARREKMPKGLKVQSQIQHDRDPAEVDPDQQQQGNANSDSEEDSDEEYKPESDEEDDEEDEYPDDDLDDDKVEEVARIAGEVPGQFAEVENNRMVAVKQEQVDDEQTEVGEILEQTEVEKPLRRSERLAELREKRQKETQTLNMQSMNVQTHGVYPAEVIARAIEYINACAIQTYTVKQGIKKWNTKGVASAVKELDQLHSQTCFVPLKLQDLTKIERKKAMEAVTFMTEKRDGTIKTRLCANGSTQRIWMDKEDKSSPTPAQGALMITAALDTAEGRSMITMDIPNAFIQTIVVSDKDGDRIILILRDKMALMLADLDPDVNRDAIQYEKGRPILYLYSTIGEVKIDMTYYVKAMVEDFEHEHGEINKQKKDSATATTPHTATLFTVDSSPILTDKRKQSFHAYVARALFLCKRAQPDIQPVIAFLSTRVKEPTEQDWYKLIRLMRYLKLTMEDIRSISVDDLSLVRFSIDASFAVHPDMRSHSGMTMNMGKGVISSGSTKQKINTRCSTTAEIVAVDDYASLMLWAREFLRAQGYDVTTILEQDNQSTIKLHKNGRQSCSKRTCHMNIKSFFMKDQVDQGNIDVQYCPTDDMISDYMTKPLVGEKFHKFKAEIMNLPYGKTKEQERQCVDEKNYFHERKRVVHFCNMQAVQPIQSEIQKAYSDIDEEPKTSSTEQKEQVKGPVYCAILPDIVHHMYDDRAYKGIFSSVIFKGERYKPKQIDTVWTNYIATPYAETLHCGKRKNHDESSDNYLRHTEDKPAESAITIPETISDVFTDILRDLILVEMLGMKPFYLRFRQVHERKITHPKFKIRRYIREITMFVAHKYVPIRKIRATLSRWLEWPSNETELMIKFQAGQQLSYMSREMCDMSASARHTHSLLDYYYLHEYRITRSTYMEFARRGYKLYAGKRQYGCNFPSNDESISNIFKLPESPAAWQHQFQFTTYQEFIRLYIYPPRYKPLEEKREINFTWDGPVPRSIRDYQDHSEAEATDDKES